MASSLAFPSSTPMGLEIERASGSYLIGSDGASYYDLISGVSVSPLGHKHPMVERAMREQMDRHLHVMVYGEYRQESQEAFAEKLTSLLPRGLDRAFLTNSGAEASEAAMKLAKAYTGRSRTVYFSGAYHGSTQGALSISDNEERKRAFRPLLPGSTCLPFNDRSALEGIDERTAAVFLETVQGDAGVQIPDRAFMEALRRRCTEKGTLLVLDEVQCGMGRTGSWWAFENFGVTPDLLTVAKAVGGGLPLGALIGPDGILQRFHQDPLLGHITTTGGHPLSCAAGKATLEAIEQEGLIEKVEEKGALVQRELQHPMVQEVRRSGLMIGVDLSSAAEVGALISKARQKGVLLFSFLSRPQAFRVAAPLNITEPELKDACTRITEALDELGAG
jgi:acetylornithine/succinyldiaminopimelate/putrescine aminotransferase